MTNGYENMNPGPRKRGIPHYYGDIVRKYLLFTGAMLLVAILVDKELLSFYLFVGIFGVLVLTILAGLMSPENNIGHIYQRHNFGADVFDV